MRIIIVNSLWLLCGEKHRLLCSSEFKNLLVFLIISVIKKEAVSDMVSGVQFLCGNLGKAYSFDRVKGSVNRGGEKHFFSNLKNGKT